MIRIGNYNPYAYYDNSNIALPGSAYMNSRTLEVPADEMFKTERVYVGGKLVYPENFRYTLKYRNRLDFSFYGNSYGYMRPSTEYTEIITNGYIEDIVRLDTASPTYIRHLALECPEDFYDPIGSSTNPKLNYPPWGRTEQYRNFSGTEHLITPACAIMGPSPGSNNNYGGSIYQKYTDNRIIPGIAGFFLGYRIIMQRTVSSSTTHPVMRSWDRDPESYSTFYTVQARKSRCSYEATERMRRGCYLNAGGETYAELKLRKDDSHYISLGYVYRKPGSSDGEGLYLCNDMDHLYGGNLVLLGSISARMPGFSTPGWALSYSHGFSIKAPPFTGHKHFNYYDTSWNVGRQEVTSWEDPNVDEWGHTDLDGSFEILENNNPEFGSIAEYVQTLLG